MVIGKCTDVSRGILWLGEGDMLGKLSIVDFVRGEEHFHEGSAGFSNIIKNKQ